MKSGSKFHIKGEAIGNEIEVTIRVRAKGATSLAEVSGNDPLIVDPQNIQTYIVSGVTKMLRIFESVDRGLIPNPFRENIIAAQRDERELAKLLQFPSAGPDGKGH